MNKIVETDDCIIVTDESFKTVPFDCPVCNLALRHYGDVISVKTYGCCDDCQLVYYWPNKEEWSQGWRPKKEELTKVANNYKSPHGEIK